MKSIRGLFFIVATTLVFTGLTWVIRHTLPVESLIPAHALALLIELSIFKRWERIITLFFFPLDNQMRIEDVLNIKDFDQFSNGQKLHIVSQEMRKQIYDLHSLFEISVQLTSILEYEKLLNTCLLSVIGQLKASGAVMLFPSQRHTHLFEPVQSKGISTKKLKGMQLSITDPLMTYFHEKSVPVNFKEFGFRSPQWTPLQKAGIVLLAPVMHQRQIIGLVGLTAKMNRLPYTQPELEIFSLMTNIASVAIANAQTYRKMEMISVTDELTGLYNRRFFTRQLQDEVARAHRFEHYVSLVMLDVDHFKKINDTFGHPVGDEILRQMGKILRDTARQSDIVSRYGGEEFCALLPEVDKTGAGYFGERIRQAIAQHDFSKQGVPEDKRITISIGAASYPNDAMIVNELLEKADNALYHAKHLGRNRVCLYSDELLAQAQA